MSRSGTNIRMLSRVFLVAFVAGCCTGVCLVLWSRYRQKAPPALPSSAATRRRKRIGGGDRPAAIASGHSVINSRARSPFTDVPQRGGTLRYKARMKGTRRAD
jgi:hypothetical protein